MNTKVFDDNIPTFDTNNPENNDMFDQIKTDFPTYDNTYLNFAVQKGLRDHVESLYSNAREYLDNNFLEEIRQPNVFRKRLWELTVFSILTKKGYIPQKIQQRSGFPYPDFCFLYNEKKVWVECVSPDIGNDPLNAPTVLHADTGMHVSEAGKEQNLSGLRISNAFSNKKEHHDRCLAKGTIDSSDLYFLAMDCSAINDVGVWHRTLDQVLYGIHPDVVSVIDQNGHTQFFSKFEDKLKKIIDGKEEEFPAAFLIREEYSWLSGILSATYIPPHKISGDRELNDVMATHFNYRLNPVPDGLFEFTKRKKVIYNEVSRLLRIDEF